MTPPTEHDPDCEPGESLTLGEMLGEGAVATVVMVTDAAGRQFAGKILHDSHRQDAAARARFGQEAELARAIVHPNVVRMFGRRTVDGRDVLLMELVRGVDLATFIARHDHEPHDGKAVVEILLGIARGLAAAHAAGVVHRDLKPSNVLLAEPNQADNPQSHAPPMPKIADFGMARASSLAGVGVDAMAVLGTPDTMAPECLDPLAVDGRTDLYALGCIAFEMLTGAPPYAAATPFGVIGAHRTAPIPEIPASVNASDGLRALVRALMAKSPADRPQAAEAVAQRLQALVDGQPTALVGPTSEHGQCADCRGALLPGLAICLACGMSVVVLRDGKSTVYVTGPGKVGEKLDAALRDRLHAWLRDNPAMGLVPAAIDKRIPRLPFVLVSKVAPDAAATLVQALQTLGLTAQAMEGNAWALPAIRNKTQSIAGRALAIASMSLVSMVGTVTQHPMTLLMGIPLLLVVGGWTAARALGPAAKRTGADGPAFPQAVRSALARVQTVAKGIEHARHREALRGVVGRTLALAPAEGWSDNSADDAAYADELAGAIDAATAATGRLDALDGQLAARDLAESSDETRLILHERDLWSARLLRLSATLESLATRRLLANVKADSAQQRQSLEELHRRVEALEEVFGS